MTPIRASAAAASFSSTIGPQHLTYRERAGGKTIVFHPTGIATPHACPRGGFPFAAVLSFLDKSKVTAKTNVPCPRR